MADRSDAASRFREVFRRVHSDHPPCLADDWLMEPCRRADGTLDPRPRVWSRRNGPWRSVEVLWVGAAPGNAGGKGRGELGAHGTRIPFGGDVAGANLDALLGSIGLTRNETFITAALNQLPTRGGGEPGFDELRAPVGDYPSSLHVLRDTALAASPRLIVALGNLAVRAVGAAATLDTGGVRLPSLERLRASGLTRGQSCPLASLVAADARFATSWATRPGPDLLWLTHPSGQNMSPFAGVGTRFHERMVEARNAVRATARDRLGWDLPGRRAAPPPIGIYALPEWRELIAPRHARLDALWRAHGI